MEEGLNRNSLSDRDHDILIEIRTELKFIGRRIDDNYITLSGLIADLQKRVAVLENDKQLSDGERKATMRMNAFISSIVATVISSLAVIVLRAIF
jgi:hypothetical protein